MAILKIDIIVKPRQNCNELETKINIASKVTGVEVKINRTSNFASFTGLAINPSQTPIVIIDGNVEFAGQVPELEVIARRLTEIQRGG